MTILFRQSARTAMLLSLSFLVPCARLGAQLRPGHIRLEVDATHAPQKILHAHMEIPVQPGPLVLLYPQWIPGEHAPSGPIINIAGLKFVAGGKTVPWRRDLINMFAFHLNIPQGVASLAADFDFLLSGTPAGFSAGSSATAFLNVLSWNQMVLYPQGYSADDLTVVPSLRLPAGWNFGTALPGPEQNGDTIDFAPVSLSMLIDSPVIAGRYFRAIQLAPGEKPSHEIDIAADSAAALAMTPETEKHFRQLVAETGALFGVRHYRDYHFLLTLSDAVTHFGLEHHESSDDRTDERSLIDDSARVDFADLLPHEFVHSWNGKYRRPEGLVSPDYQQPMRDDLLWVYEGLTEYLGDVLTSRSGLWNEQQSRESLASIAASLHNEPGRAWRPLQDTADSAVFLYGGDAEWSNWRRSVDFYDEGQLLWLDVDTTLRRLTNDRKSMNDFCLLFYSGAEGQPALKPYKFEDVVTTLNSLAPYDWSGFLRTRLDSAAPNTPIEALENAGWKIVYNDKPNDIQENAEQVRKEFGFSLSIGLALAEDGTVVNVTYGGPAYKAGIGPGMKVTAVNAARFSGEALKGAITDAESSSEPIQLIIANGTQVQTYSIEYHGGLRRPHLERDQSHPDYLGEILHPLAP